MSEEKAKVRVIKKSQTPAANASPAVQPAATPEKKVVVIKKKIVTVKARVKDEKKEEAATVQTAAVPAQAETQTANAQEAARKPASRPLVQPSSSRLASTVPAANRNLVGGERVRSTVLNGPVVIKAENLPPVPGQITSEAEYTLKLELVAGDGTILQTRRIRLPEDDGLNSGSTGSGTGIIDTESAYRYPVVANHFYAIGSPDSPVDLQGEGGDLVITIDPTWEGEVDLGISEKQ